MGTGNQGIPNSWISGRIGAGTRSQSIKIGNQQTAVFTGRRGRSNALTGWGDQRSPLPRPIERNYLAALDNAGAMAPELESFVNQVFYDPHIMKPETSPSDRSQMIYNLYATGDSTTNAAPQPGAQKFFEDIGRLTLGWPKCSIYFQYTTLRSQNGKSRHMTLQDVLLAVESGLNIPDAVYMDFLYFGGVGQGVAKFRLYLNVHLESMPQMAGYIFQYIHRNKDHGAVAFKLACPKAAVGRADTIVIYCTDKAKAQALGEHLCRFGQSFRQQVPAMTTRLGPGVAMGAEPEWQATGMQAAPEGYPESAQSFGSIRSQLIAMAIENYNENKSQIQAPNDFQKFKRFVCAAFRGYGLDPLRPGD